MSGHFSSMVCWGVVRQAVVQRTRVAIHERGNLVAHRGFALQIIFVVEILAHGRSLRQLWLFHNRPLRQFWPFVLLAEVRFAVDWLGEARFRVLEERYMKLVTLSPNLSRSSSLSDSMRSLSDDLSLSVDLSLSFGFGLLSFLCLNRCIMEVY
jgi:hypothetical protein